MNAATQRLCLWCGIAMMVVWFAGFGIAGFLPLPSPNDTPQQVAETYLAHTTSVRIGLILAVLACALLAPFISVIAVQLRRVEGRTAPMSTSWLALAAILVLQFLVPLYIMEACTFRSNRDLAILEAMNDIAWIMFIVAVQTTFLMMIACGIVILRDKRTEPIFPRWMGYMSFLVAFTMLCGNVIIFFKTGPLAWNGAFAWWVPVGVYGVWVIAMTVCMLRAIARQEHEEKSQPIAQDAWELDVERKVELLSAELDALKANRHLAPSTGG
jgi:hypothetical protein